jgi:predicted permease
MSWRRHFARLRGLFGRDADDLADEIRSHLEMERRENIEAGMPPDEARYAALRRFGNTLRAEERSREMWTWTLLETLWQDVRYGLRQLRANPGFTLVAVLTLALGVGANTAIFGVVDAVLLRPLPYKDPARLVWVTEHFARGSAGVISPDFAGWQEHNHVFEQIGATSSGSGANLTGTGPAARVSITNVTVGFFPMLGVRPLLGRLFIPSEGKLGQEHVALISESLWRNQFGSDARIAGKTIQLDGAPFTVVGVMPAGLRPTADLWTPFASDEARFSPQSPTWAILTVVGRLKSGVSISQAQSDLEVIAHQMDRLYPPQAAHFRAQEQVEVLPLQELLVRNVRSLLLVLLGASTLVLLIACVNVANLLLSRGATRSREMAVRAALGARRSRLIRQSFTEALLLAAGGSAVGSAVGLSSTAILNRLIPPGLSPEIHFDLRMFAFAVAVAGLAVLAFGLAPALIVSRTDIAHTLKLGALSSAAGPGTHRLRTGMSTVEIALSLVLMVGAALLARSLLRLSEVPLGFDPHGLLLGTVQRPMTVVSDPSRNIPFFESALERVQKLPGVTGAALTVQYPLGPPHNGILRLNVQGGPQAQPPGPMKMTAISPTYFRVMRIPLLSGRVFTDADTAAGQPVVIMNDVLARLAFASADPIGRRVSLTSDPGTWLSVVGVVGSVRGDSLEQEPAPELFTPYPQQPAFSMTFLLRSESDPRPLAGALRNVIQQMDRNQPMTDATAMDDVIATAIGSRRFNALLVGAFALLAMLLAAVGVYGVVAYFCSQRTHEFGIRMALGAERSELVRMVLRAGARIAIAGAAIGFVGSLAVTRFLSSMLYGVTPHDPATLAGVAALLVLVALGACYVPARRAAKVEPMVALRYE